MRDEGDARWLREGCECERRGLPDSAECIYDSPCPNSAERARLRAEGVSAASDRGYDDVVQPPNADADVWHTSAANTRRRFVAA